MKLKQRKITNRQWGLAERFKGELTKDTLTLIEAAIPAAGDNQMLLRTEYLSLNPYMRDRMSDTPSHAVPVEIGEVMVGGTVAQVVNSNIDGFAPGDYVLSFNGWQDYALSDGTGLTNLGKSPLHPSWTLGILGMAGFTAWAGETIAVTAAIGPVGATAAQIGKLLGCRVVGTADGAEKCAYAVDVLGFTACIDHKAPDFADQLAKAIPDGIDVYFDNLGGKILDVVTPLLNPNAQIPPSKLVSQYNATNMPAGPERMNWLIGQMLRKKIKVHGYIIFDDFGHIYPDFAKEMNGWVESGKIKYRERIIEGLENASQAFIDLVKGENIGKRVIHVGQT